ncbi:hypothetical protein U1Q18_029976, partial [Sarracenia purpurea var. burkii]
MSCPTRAPKAGCLCRRDPELRIAIWAFLASRLCVGAEILKQPVVAGSGVGSAVALGLRPSLASSVSAIYNQIRLGLGRSSSLRFGGPKFRRRIQPCAYLEESAPHLSFP